MVTVALLAAIGVFVAVSAATKTPMAITDVPVDWQVQITRGTDVQGVIDMLGQATPYTGVEVRPHPPQPEPAGRRCSAATA